MSAIQNSSGSEFQNAPVTNSKLHFGSKGSAVWELENWSDPTSFEVLKKHANCVVGLNDGRSFRFFLKEQKIRIDPPEKNSHYTWEYECLSLFVKEQDQKHSFEDGFNLKVAIQHLNDELQPIVDYGNPFPNVQDWTSVHVSFESGRKAFEEREVVDAFICLSYKQEPHPEFFNNDPIAITQARKTYNFYSSTINKRPEKLRYGITVQLLSCNAPSSSSSDP